MTLAQMKDVDIRSVDPATLVDVKDIRINTNAPVPERMADYVCKAGNPYAFKVGKILVKLSYSDTAVTVADCFERYMKTC